MIEQDVRDLEDKICRLEDKIEDLISAIENNKFYYEISDRFCSYWDKFDSVKDADAFIAQNISKDLLSFKKSSPLSSYELSSIKISRKIEL